jgi:hypothetical protein
MRRRLVLSAAILVGTFVSGALASRWLEREAQARPASQSASIFVPPDGLAFRTMEGRMIARISYDARGGVVEVFDGNERSTGAMRSGFVSGLY